MGNIKYEVISPDVFARVIIRMIERECGLNIKEDTVVLVVDPSGESSTTYTIEEAIALKIREYGRQRERSVWLRMHDQCGEMIDSLVR